MSAEKKAIYGLIGLPVAHSLSPLMHNAAFRELSINAQYELFELKPQDLADFFSSLSLKGIQGLNVTIPHKEKVIPFLNNVSKQAELIGAVNTVKVSGKNLEGFNTDGDGFLKHLKEDLGFLPEGKNIAILGAGGACRAVCVTLARNQARRIIIYDIDKNKLAALAGALQGNFPKTEFQIADSVNALKIKESNLLVNATPIGMKDVDPVLVGKDLLHPSLLVYDLIYNPAETKLLRLAGECGAKTSNGLGMLLYQGVLAFEIWTGQKAPVEIMRQALNEGAKKI